MPRIDRQDEPGAWHHVMNRGIARRVAFQDDEDIRFFLSRIARSVRRGEVELHAFAILATHFHLLVRSPAGRLSYAMRRCEHEYVRWFNRRRRRDGPLFRGRFQSRRVANAAYWDTLVHYIDDNPVGAGIVSDATEYPWCSAWHYARARRPGWLSRAEVERAVVASTGAACDHDSYRRFTTARDPDASRWIVERRLASTRTTGLDPLDDLVLAAPRAVLDWMRRKAMLADGSSFGDVAASPRRLEQELDRAAGSMRRSMSDEQLLACRAGLLRDFAGLNLREICSRLDRPMSTVMRRIVDHRRRVAVDDPYGEFAAAVAFHAMR